MLILPFSQLDQTLQVLQLFEKDEILPFMKCIRIFDLVVVA
jgi:hypothetical protein